MDKILKLLNDNAHYTDADIAVMLGMEEKDVSEHIRALERNGIICGYKPVVDWEKEDSTLVTALIEIKVIPKQDEGFETIAEQIMMFEEVESVYLMSGGFDLAVMVQGKTFREVAMFVAKRLAPMDSVQSTATHFVLRRYKEMGVKLSSGEEDDRSFVI